MADKVKNKVILFFPGRFLLGADPQLPLSVLALAGPLMDHGFETVIIDGRVDKWRSRFVEELDDNVLFVGFTALTSDMILYGLEASKWVRQFKPDIRIVWGGVHASLLPEQTIETGEVIDIVARGEGEDIIVNLASAIRSGSKLEDVFGLTFRNNEGKIVSNPDPPNRVDLEKLNLPPYHILDLSKYSMRNFMYMSARGCPHKCQFCDVMAFHHRRYSAKSVQKTLDELEYIIKTYHPESIEFVDDNFFVRRERALEICQGIIDRGLKFEWIASCRADYFKHMNDQYWETVRDAGAKAIYIGAESGSVRTLKEIEKGITIEDVYNAAEQLSRVGIKMSC
ncbi:MAG: B12-binding domain-containing radical SAM protein, partial [Candidatus Saccharibacteria bacterium]